MRVQRSIRALLTAASAAVVFTLPGTAAGFVADPLPDAMFSDLIGAVETEIMLITSPAPFADDDLQDRRWARIARADPLIGTVRVEAARRVASLFSEIGLPVEALTASRPAAMRPAVAAMANRWKVETVAQEWQRLDEVLDELRDLVADAAPHRVCPVLGDLWFEDDWHDQRPWGRAHKGNDLHAEPGTPLAAIEAGTVLQANWHWSGGRQIYFSADATGDVYYYAHLAEWSDWIWTGTRVEAGDVIGLLGDSGNASTPHLHLGWMPGSYTMDLDNLQNPYPLLVEICP
jgi:murein DD-endopeptidase MepM/ murein hydrolase activator NlpD